MCVLLFFSSIRSPVVSKCQRYSLFPDSDSLCDIPRKHMPARLAIFVAWLGRKFHHFSLTMQRYENFRGLPNLNAKKARKKART